jgi:hypothetical protein
MSGIKQGLRLVSTVDFTARPGVGIDRGGLRWQGAWPGVVLTTRVDWYRPSVSPASGVGGLSRGGRVGIDRGRLRWQGAWPGVVLTARVDRYRSRYHPPLASAARREVAAADWSTFFNLK